VAQNQRADTGVCPYDIAAGTESACKASTTQPRALPWVIYGTKSTYLFAGSRFFVSMKKTFLFRDSWHCFADSTAMPCRFYSNALPVQ
jgi:hypothetical protein